MKKSITPQEAYLIVAKKARKVNKSPSGYAASKGVSRFVISKWKHKTTGTINLDMALKLELI